VTAISIEQSEWLKRPATRKLLKAFADADVPVRFVGGCVRDTLLALPVADFDLATPAKPPRVIELLEDARIKVIPTGLAHGTVTAVVDKQPFEITTLRRDEETDGRHAKVAFTADWKEDAARRDFTLNALYADANGKLYDYFGGVEDAKAGHVRFIGEAAERIHEDALRILRFFRFNARFGRGEPDHVGLNACRIMAPALDRLSGERIQTEMFKLFTAPRAAEALMIMQKEDVLPHILPGVRHLERLGRLRELEAMSQVASSPVRSLALILHSGRAQALETIAFVQERWKLSNADTKRLTFLANHALGNIGEMEQKRQLRNWGRELFLDRLLIEWARGADADYEAMLKLVRSWAIPVFPLAGADLIEAGFKPGPELGKKLEALEALWEDSGYTLSKKALLAAIKK
jgi:poly(A) polymerase